MTYDPNRDLFDESNKETLDAIGYVRDVALKALETKDQQFMGFVLEQEILN